MMTLAHQTRIVVHIVVDDDTGRVANLIAALTFFITILLTAGQLIADIREAIYEIGEEMTVVSKAFVILIRAWLYGLGVPL